LPPPSPGHLPGIAFVNFLDDGDAGDPDVRDAGTLLVRRIIRSTVR
jgi:hypothetical protein